MPAIISSISPCIPMRQDRMADMEGHLILVDGSEPEVTAENVKRLLDSSARFWLDLAGLDQDTGSAVTARHVRISPACGRGRRAFRATPKVRLLRRLRAARRLRRHAGRAAGRSALLLHRELSGHRPPRPMPRPGRPGRPTTTTSRPAPGPRHAALPGGGQPWSTATSRSWPASTTRSTSWRTRSCSDPPSSSWAGCST